MVIFKITEKLKASTGRTLHVGKKIINTRLTATIAFTKQEISENKILFSNLINNGMLIRVEEEEVAKKAEEEVAKKAEEEVAKKAKEETTKKAEEEVAKKAKEETAKKAKESNKKSNKK